MGLIGKAVVRLEDDRLLRGRGRFTDDFDKPDQGYAAFLRSDVAKGVVTVIDLEAAKAHPAVRLAVGALDAPGLGIGCFPSLGAMPDQTVRSRPVMPSHIRHVGEILAMVVADDPQSASDALELIEVEIKAGESADEPAYLWRHGDYTSVETELTQAHWTVTVEAESNRVCVHPMEARAALADVDPTTGRITLITGSQGAHKIRDMIAARSVLTPPSYTSSPPTSEALSGSNYKPTPNRP